MFGNAPRALWERWCPPDDLGRIELACRCFLVDDGERRMLIETGVGCFFEPALRERYGVTEDAHLLLTSLEALGLSPPDIDVVFLSHLHFDHAGGLLSRYAPNQALSLAFPRAEYVVSESALARARSPHPRDRASFIPELLPLLEQSGRLVVVPAAQTTHSALGRRISLWPSEGHTPGMLLPVLEGQARRALFCADLVPGAPWVHLPITMGYDRFPEALIDEKRAMYEELGEGALLLFTHDPNLAAAELQRDQRGRYGAARGVATLVGVDLDVA